MSEISLENSKQKRGLGRGLGSLLGGAAESVPTAPSSSEKISLTTTASPAPASPEGRVWQVGIDKLRAGVYQPRKTFEKTTLQELSQSIKENGILQPLIVRKTKSGAFEIVAGERRWRAAQMAGLHEVPVLIRSYEDKETLELSIIENVQREDLNPLEEAEAYARLAGEFRLSQQQIADKVGKDRATVANAIRLLALGKDVKAMLNEGLLSVGHAKVLLSLPDEKKQAELARQVTKEKWPVRKLEKIVSEILAGPTQKKATAGSEAASSTMNQLVSALGEELQKRFGTKVSIDYQAGRGKIGISFYSDEQLNQIIEQLKIGSQK